MEKISSFVLLVVERDHRMTNDLAERGELVCCSVSTDGLVVWAKLSISQQDSSVVSCDGRQAISHFATKLRRVAKCRRTHIVRIGRKDSERAS